MPNKTRTFRNGITAALGRCSSLFLLLALCLPAFAHDFWLSTSNWSAPPGGTVTISANVGDDSYPVSQFATAANRIDWIKLIGPTQLTVTPQYKATKAAITTKVSLPSQSGTYIVAMQVKPHFLAMKSKEFAAYLAEEGLKQIIEERERSNETNKPSHELYTRQAKLLIRVGDGSNSRVTEPVGLEAELVPDRDLSQSHSGDVVTVKLIYKGNPVPGAQVTLTSAAPGPTKSRAVRMRTDANGKATFTLRGQGPFLFTAVHMVRIEDSTAEWKSYWCSLTFNN